MLRCRCGKELEEGFLGILWCSKCEDNWGIPKGRQGDRRYYFTIKHQEHTLKKPRRVNNESKNS